MCFYFKQSKDALTLAKRFKVKVNENDSFVKGEFNAFTFPRVPVITDKARDRIFGFNWGLIPDYESDISIRKFTLNGRIETLDSVRSYRNYIQNRCLIISDGFYEWGVDSENGEVKSETGRGKIKKCKYLISLQDDSLFTFAGIYSPNGTFTLLTTYANNLLGEIHSPKQRMPVILKPDQEKKWLDRADINLFYQPGKFELSAKLIDTGREFKKNSNLDDNLIF